jgi:hypothetical protein
LTDIAPARSAYTVKEHRRCIEHDIKPALGSVRLAVSIPYYTLPSTEPSSGGIIPINPADRA